MTDSIIGAAYIREVDGARSTIINVSTGKVTLEMYNQWVSDVQTFGSFQIGNSLFVPAHMDFSPSPVNPDPVTPI